MAEEVRERVVGIIAEQAVLEPADVTMDATLADLGIDSLGLVEAIFAIEEAFDISVPFNANAPEESPFDISSVAAIVAAVEGLIAEQKGTGASGTGASGTGASGAGGAGPLSAGAARTDEGDG
jgi:acyl carrier protein